MILGIPAGIGFLVGLFLGTNLDAAVVGAGFGVLVGMFVIAAGFVFDAWD
jgi:hypothetical protein